MTLSVGTTIHPVMGTGPTTTRTSTDLLTLPLPYIQRPLLEPEDFIKECDRRGIKLTMSLLEDLHRHKILVPFYRVREGAPSPKDVVDVSKSSIPDLGTSGLISRLIVPASEGRVTDPSSERFLRWRRRRPSDLEPLSRQTGYWYSYHQILTVVRAKGLIGDRETVFRRTRDPKRPATSQRLKRDALPTEHDQRSAATLRSLAVLLSALDTRYWPEIFRRVYWYDEWAKLESNFSPQAMLSWLRSDSSELAERAERLRVDGGFADPTGDFYDLIRRARPEIWDSLSGDALIAMDVRIAAEVIELFLGQLSGVEIPSSPQVHLKHQRLSARDKSLDESLTITGLSPHPSLVVAVEGATEYLVIPRVFAALDVALDPSWIRIENFNGVDRDLVLLAQYAGSFALGQDRGPFVTLAKPVTRLIVLVDPEKDYATAEKRRRQKSKLLDAMVASVPSHLQNGLRTSGSCLLTIRTWGRHSFEFAHFSDSELASAIIGLRPDTYPLEKPELVKQLRSERRKYPNTKHGNGPKFDKFLRLTSDRAIGKPELAEALWPVLEARIRSALTTGSRKPPVMKAVERAVHLALLSHRSHLALEKTKTR